MTTSPLRLFRVNGNKKKRRKKTETNNVNKRNMVKTPNWQVGDHLANYTCGRGAAENSTS